MFPDKLLDALPLVRSRIAAHQLAQTLDHLLVNDDAGPALLRIVAFALTVGIPVTIGAGWNCRRADAHARATARPHGRRDALVALGHGAQKAPQLAVRLQVVDARKHHDAPVGLERVQAPDTPRDLDQRDGRLPRVSKHHGVQLVDAATLAKDLAHIDDLHLATAKRFHGLETCSIRVIASETCARHPELASHVVGSSVRALRAVPVHDGGAPLGGTVRHARAHALERRVAVIHVQAVQGKVAHPPRLHGFGGRDPNVGFLSAAQGGRQHQVPACVHALEPCAKAWCRFRRVVALVLDDQVEAPGQRVVHQPLVRDNHDGMVCAIVGTRRRVWREAAALQQLARLR